jgi:sodium/potassium-transporting ATPase subunit alpha
MENDEENTPLIKTTEPYQKNLFQKDLKSPISKKKIPYTEHLLTLKQLDKLHALSRIHVDDVQGSIGLGSDLVSQLQETYGSNMINPPPSTPLWLLFLYQFSNMFMILLLVGALLCFGCYLYDPSDMSNLYLSIFLVIVVVSCFC